MQKDRYDANFSKGERRKSELYTVLYRNTTFTNSKLLYT